ncbi:hypothetical protein FA95DRAFT_1556007 [Auriscalpium vulgare]|uniref:Uncharacterized protein n=1 Tax=Auriscalpium vulgare TaxID=40419 RepID=A0ACB8S2J3_9AGAM|nr:hypothetical protein FA95DRAFT_1556007 [Auriscalpium vulgare]
MALSIFLLSVAIFPILTLASRSTLPLPALLPPLLARSLEGRQFDPSTIPTQCQSSCDTVVNTISACTTVTCTCSASNAADLTSCVGCLVGLDPAQGQDGQNLLDDFTQECAQAGLPVSGQTSTAAGTGTPAVETATPLSAAFPPAPASSTPAAPTAIPAGAAAKSSGVTVSVPASTGGSGLGAGFKGGAPARGAGALAVGVLGVTIGLAGVLVL